MVGNASLSIFSPTLQAFLSYNALSSHQNYRDNISVDHFASHLDFDFTLSLSCAIYFLSDRMTCKYLVTSSSTILHMKAYNHTQNKHNT